MTSIDSPLPGFSVRVTRREGQVNLKLWGDLTGATAPSLHDALSDLIRRGSLMIVVDLSELSRFRTGGLGPLVSAFKDLRARGGDLVLHAPSVEALEVLEAAGLSRTMTISGAPGALNRQELKVLTLVTRAMHNREIARELSISEASVRQHLSRIFVKLNVSTRAAAAASALRKKLVPLPETQTPIL